MSLINILLKDNKNKLFQKMLFLREETELLICENINTINKKVVFLNIHSIDIDSPMTELEKNGWKEDNGLYDKLIIEYNNSAEREKLLTRWK